MKLRDKVEAAYQKRYRVDEDGVPRNPNGDELKGSHDNVWSLSVYIGGMTRAVSVFALSARCHWDRDRFEDAARVVWEHEERAFVPRNKNPYDARPENIKVGLRADSGIVSHQYHEQIAERYENGEDETKLAAEFGTATDNILRIVEKVE